MGQYNRLSIFYSTVQGKGRKTCSMVGVAFVLSQSHYKLDILKTLFFWFNIELDKKLKRFSRLLFYDFIDLPIFFSERKVWARKINRNSEMQIINTNLSAKFPLISNNGPRVFYIKDLFLVYYIFKPEVLNLIITFFFYKYYHLVWKWVLFDVLILIHILRDRQTEKNWFPKLHPPEDIVCIDYLVNFVFEYTTKTALMKKLLIQIFWRNFEKLKNSDNKILVKMNLKIRWDYLFYF